MGAPQLIRFDEPSLGLAPAVVYKVLDTIRDLNRDGVTCLLVEQNVALSLKLASRAEPDAGFCPSASQVR